MWHVLVVLVPALLLASCGEGDEDAIYGYAEGRFRMLAPENEGRIVALMVMEGDKVEAGSVIARLNDSTERAQLAEAEARAAAAEARLKDASLGGREPEIQAARELLAQAEATAREATEELGRVRPLFQRGVVARARLDQAEATARSAEARVAELRERLTMVQLPARENLLRALEADAEAAKAAMTAAREALLKRTITAPEPGRIERLLREPGETAGPSAPIVRYLPADALMAIGFIPEAQLGGFALGDRLEVSCDGCPGTLTAVVTSISQEAAFTAPTIFSDRERARLVFRLEARFTGAAPPSGTPLRLRRVP
jgi:HlyD family secretion protein